jgi:hypothetical protein
LRGTDKVVRPKVPPEAHFPLVDAYLAAHGDAIIFVATDDNRYMRRLAARYGYYEPTRQGFWRGARAASGRIVFRGSGYEKAAWGGVADATHWHDQVKTGAASASSKDGYARGMQVILDALLLSKCDFVLMSASAVSEFALWVAPHLWGRHLDLQTTNRFKGQRMPEWTKHVPGAVAIRGRRRAVAHAFCTALASACANETAQMYKHCSKCDPPRSAAEEDAIANALEEKLARLARPRKAGRFGFVG